MSETTPTVHLMFEPADPANRDPAALASVADAAVAALRHDGYTVTPVYTGTRGGDAFEIVRQAAQAVYDNKDLLIPLVGLAKPIVEYLLKQHEKKTSTPSQPAPATKVVVVIDQTAIPLNASDAASDQTLLAALLRAEPQLRDKLTPHSRVAVRVRVGTLPAVDV